jgi:hypothetical protein
MTFVLRADLQNISTTTGSKGAHFIAGAGRGVDADV